MAEAKENKPRTFVKKGRDGKQLTRTVTTASDEVAARFDGFHEETSTKSSPPAGGTGSASAGRASSSS